MVAIDDGNELEDHVGFEFVEGSHLEYILAIAVECVDNTEYLIILLIRLAHQQRIHHPQPHAIRIISNIAQRR